MALRKKQLVFIEHYLMCWNSAEAARLAGYSENSARQQGSRLLTNADIQAEIDARIAELKMSADEALVRLAEQGRGDMRSFIGKTVQELQEHPQGRVIKNFKHTVTHYGKDHKEETIEVALYNAQAALQLIGRHHKLFTDKHEHTGKDGEQLIIAVTKMDVDEL